ncbi:hypothetical protein H072_2567 [Dactylellina haptotyla CBS 200.50]|uniref:Mitochondrial distribution and morphology protein 35 n=1 Tax=Dactylellina haptotyla (strain CBS 200.50) TaxID=1284197 RepID=S8AQU5_DACHA|nr:hypothetical protein H072_2567 [Dactylellina haptotyla CBS 200.50]
MSASLSPECLPAKEKYDACFIRWYTESTLRPSLPPSLVPLQTLVNGGGSTSTLLTDGVLPEFLRGERTEDEACKKLFLEYSHCLKKALDSKGIGKMLDDARKNAEESDGSRRGS